jgi:uncharacterized membrane protein
VTPATGSSEPGPTARLLATLAYAGGAISGVILLVMEKRDRFVRFHAMQSVVTFVGVMVAHLVLTSLPLVGRLLSAPFVVAVVVLWIILMSRAWRGQWFKLPQVGDFAEHLLT